jgi:hypothetical protein
MSLEAKIDDISRRLETPIEKSIFLKVDISEIISRNGFLWSHHWIKK